MIYRLNQVTVLCKAAAMDLLTAFLLNNGNLQLGKAQAVDKVGEFTICFWTSSFLKININ